MGCKDSRLRSSQREPIFAQLEECIRVLDDCLQREDIAAARHQVYSLQRLLDRPSREGREGVLQRIARGPRLVNFLGREYERADLAHQLRSGTGQLLANAAAELNACIPLLEGESDAIRDGLLALEQELRDGLEQLRWLLAELERPTLLQDVGLTMSLQSYVDRFSARFGVAVHMELNDVPDPIPEAIALVVFRLVQEALTNAQRHGQARSVWITARRDSDAWIVTVTDDGLGFVQASVEHVGGLVKLHDWAEAAGGDVRVSSAPGQGALVQLSLPYPQSQ